MNAMTCQQVEGQLDLLAASECDLPTRVAVERHLERCSACAASFADSQRLQGQLDLHWDEAGPNRVSERIEEAERLRRRRSVVLPLARRLAAVAALVLVVVGSWLLPSGESRQSAPGLQLVRVDRDDAAVDTKENRLTQVPAMGDPEARFQKAEPKTLRLVLPRADSSEAYLRELRQAQHEGKLPLPPAVPLVLALKNGGSRPLEVRLGDAATELLLEVQGKGVVRIPAPGAAEPEFLQPRPLQLAPGEQYDFRIDRLIVGARGRIEYIYLLEPGEYTLTARLRVTVGAEVTTVTSDVVRIELGN